MKKIVLLLVALQLVIFAYSQTGRPDLSFGNGGFLGNGIPSRSVYVQSDGKIVTASVGSKNGVGGFLIARYNSNGSPDNSFGGDGRIVANFGLSSQSPTSVIVQEDGKILVAGFGSSSNQPLYVEIVARFNTDGSVDNSFNGTGNIMIGGISDGNYLALQSNGKIIMAGQYFVTRFTSSGTIDSSFGTNGKIYSRFLTLSYAVVVRDDKIIIAGFNNGEGLSTSESNFGLTRFNANGSLDSTFDGNGVVSTAIEGGSAVAQSLVIQPDGKLLVAGSVRQISKPSQFAIVRYNTNGSLDNSFDGDGVLLTDFSTQIALQGNGKILAAGVNTVARYNTDGSPDATFGSNGKTTTDISPSGVKVFDTRLYVLGQKNNSGILGAYYLGEAPQTGLFYKYFEGSWNTLPDFNTLVPLKTGNTSNINVEERASGRNDNYAFIWRGYINITTPGVYTFETVSDDGSKIYFNTSYGADSTALVNNDGLHAPVAATGTVNIPTAGVYPITFTYFEKDGGESMQAYWTGPGITRQLIPNLAFQSAPDPGSNGLTYKYYEGTWNTLPDFSSLLPARTGSSPNVDINLRNPGRNDNYGFVWEGSINIPAAGEYTFTTVSDDGSKLYFNSLYSPSATATVNNDGLHAATSASGTVNVPVAGAYPIAITFFEKDGDESLKVYWSGPGIPMQQIPNAAFSKVVTPPTPTGGLNYKYYQGNYSVLPNFNTQLPFETGNTPNIDLGVRRPTQNDNFAILWEGFIKIDNPGMYTFETVSDDGSKLYFNTLYNPDAIATVNNDGVHAAVSATGLVNIAAAGVYPITISYFEKDGGEAMQVYWTGPGIPRQLIPNSAFVKGMPDNGLNYKYYEGSWNTLPDFNALTPVKTGLTTSLNLGVRTPGRNDNFAFLWEGYLTVPVAGNYTIEVVSDDGSKFYFNNFYGTFTPPSINNDGVHPPTSASVNLNISATYPIAVTYFEKDGGETIQLYWTGPGIPKQLIPNSAFTPRNPVVSATAVNGDVTPFSAASEMAAGTLTKVYPNPFAERFTISFYNDKPTDDVSVAIYDLNGKQLYNQYAGRFAQGNASLIVNLKDRQFKDGIYMVTVSKNGVRSTTMKLIKQR